MNNFGERTNAPAKPDSNRGARALLGLVVTGLLVIPNLMGLAGSAAMAADIVTNPGIGPTTGGTEVTLPATTSITDNAATSDASYFLTDGVVFALGDNSFGQLGTSYSGKRDFYAPIDMPEGVHFTSIAPTARGGFALGDDGNVWSWGADMRSCQTPLPAAVSTPYLAFTPPEGTTVVEMTVGYFVALVLLSDGSVYSWASNMTINAASTLGRGLPEGTSAAAACMPAPVTMPEGVRFTSIAGGSSTASYALALGDNGKIYGWGSNAYGVLGNTISEYEQSTVPIEIPMPELEPGDQWKQVSAGSSAAALTESGQLFLWGGNNAGSLGRGLNYPAVLTSRDAVAVNPSGVSFKSAHMGYTISFAVASDDTLYGWGDNQYLGSGTFSSQITRPASQGFKVSSFSVMFYSTNAISLDGKGYAANYANPAVSFGGGIRKRELVFDMGVTAMKFPAGAGTNFSWTDGLVTATTPPQATPGAVDVSLEYNNLPWAATPSAASSTVIMHDAFRYYDPNLADTDQPNTFFEVSELPDLIANGETKQIVTVSLVNEVDEPISGAQDTLLASTEFDLGEGELGGFAETSTPGTYEAEVTSTVAGSAPITVSYTSGTGSPAAVNPRDVEGDPVNTNAVFVAGPVAVATSDFSVPEEAVTVGETQTIEVFLNDAFGNPVTEKAESLTASLESVATPSARALLSRAAMRLAAADPAARASDFSAEFSDFVEDEDGPGRYTGTVASTVPGVATIAVEFGGEETPEQAPALPLTASGNRNATFLVGAMALDQTVLLASPDARVADGVEAATIDVKLTDEYGNPVVGPDTVELRTTLGTLGEVTKTANGVYTAQLVSVEAGTAAVTVAVEDELAPASAEVVFTAIPVAPEIPEGPQGPAAPVSPGADLAATGADSAILTSGALLLAGAGAWLLLFRRRQSARQ